MSLFLIMKLDNKYFWNMLLMNSGCIVTQKITCIYIYACKVICLIPPPPQLEHCYFSSLIFILYMFSINICNYENVYGGLWKVSFNYLYLIWWELPVTFFAWHCLLSALLIYTIFKPSTINKKKVFVSLIKTKPFHETLKF